MTLRLDIIGDLHGNLLAFVRLARHLGYAVDSDIGRGDWSHPEGRILVFVGDLIDRGNKSLELAELVMSLVEQGRALCLMGNHEYNLVAWRVLGHPPKHSNGPTIADVEERSERWERVLGFFATLPIAIELPDLRVIHAAWHRDAFAAVEPVLGREPQGLSSEFSDPIDVLEDHIRLVSPFVLEPTTGLAPGLPSAPLLPPANDLPHEILLKGFERETPEPFLDNDGKERRALRVRWWDEGAADVPRDRMTVYGHYWNLPPAVPTNAVPPWRGFAPPAASGTPALREWFAAYASAFPLREVIGEAGVPPEVDTVCVDFNGVSRAAGGACAGAYRYPERRIVWARTDTDAGTPQADRSTVRAPAMT